MGLDMYLRGRKYLWSEKRTEDGFEVSHIELELGYWRKHPNLHGYIVQMFADGVDECQQIQLDEQKLIQLRDAARNPANLPPTTGFFFGASYGTKEEAVEDVAIIDKAIAWLKSAPNGEFRDVYYRASW